MFESNPNARRHTPFQMTRVNLIEPQVDVSEPFTIRWLKRTKHVNHKRKNKTFHDYSKSLHALDEGSDQTAATTTTMMMNRQR